MTAPVDPLRYYDLEKYLFEDVRQRFLNKGSLGAFDVFSIIIWKANRAKSKIAHRMLQNHDDLESACRKLTEELARATSPEHRLSVLMADWGFYLPMATAILSVLWPNDFTVYDVRVCDELHKQSLGEFRNLGNKVPRLVWEAYAQYRNAVRDAVPEQSSLRDKDRILWARSAMSQLEQDIQRGFGSPG